MSKTNITSKNNNGDNKKFFKPYKFKLLENSIFWLLFLRLNNTKTNENSDKEAADLAFYQRFIKSFPAHSHPVLVSDRLVDIVTNQSVTFLLTLQPVTISAPCFSFFFCTTSEVNGVKSGRKKTTVLSIVLSSITTLTKCDLGIYKPWQRITTMTNVDSNINHCVVAN